jgi:hypothetical protein
MRTRDCLEEETDRKSDMYGIIQKMRTRVWRTQEEAQPQLEVGSKS